MNRNKYESLFYFIFVYCGDDDLRAMLKLFKLLKFQEKNEKIHPDGLRFALSLIPQALITQETGKKEW